MIEFNNNKYTNLFDIRHYHLIVWNHFLYKFKYDMVSLHQ
jgi:hypothetical protein